MQVTQAINARKQVGICELLVNNESEIWHAIGSHGYKYREPNMWEDLL